MTPFKNVAMIPSPFKSIENNLIGKDQNETLPSRLGNDSSKTVMAKQDLNDHIESKRYFPVGNHALSWPSI
jgi:hypothetical protein